MPERTLARLFTDHPRAVGETYGQHMVTAASFGWRLVAGGVACMVHAVVPGLCVSTGSRTIIGLHRRMVENRIRHGIDPVAHGHSFRDHGLGI